jgi:putative alpha-1,2-mannosidase
MTDLGQFGPASGGSRVELLVKLAPPSMAHLLNFAGAPWLSQKWVRAVKAQILGATTPRGLGDEDRGQLAPLAA